MSRLTVDFYLLPWQEEVEDLLEAGGIRSLLVECGIYSGKTDYWSAKCLEWMGEDPGCNIGWFAGIKWQLERMWETFSPLAARAGGHNSTYPFYDSQWANGSRLMGLTAKNIDLLSTFHYDYVLIDEAAKLGTKAAELILLRSAGAKLFVPFSTPRDTPHWNAWRKQGKSGKDGWAMVHCTTEEAGILSKDEVARLRASLRADLAAQELDAIVVPAAGNVFRNVHACSTGRPFAGGGKSKTGEPLSYLLTWDPAKVADMSAWAVWRQRRCVRAGTLPPGMPYKDQSKLVANISREYNQAVTIVDATGPGVAAYETLLEEAVNGPEFDVVPYTFDGPRKASLVNDTALAFEQKGIQLINPDLAPPDERDTYKEMRKQISIFEKSRSASGINYTYNAPDGENDDFVSCVLLMMVFEAGARVEVLGGRQ